MLNLESCQSNEEHEEKVLNKNIKTGVIHTCAHSSSAKNLSDQNKVLCWVRTMAGVWPPGATAAGDAVSGARQPGHHQQFCFIIALGSPAADPEECPLKVRK